MLMFSSGGWMAAEAFSAQKGHEQARVSFIATPNHGHARAEARAAASKKPDAEQEKSPSPNGLRLFSWLPIQVTDIQQVKTLQTGHGFTCLIFQACTL